jgi:5-formyltetrahydrofolate cyclo-ligase family
MERERVACFPGATDRIPNFAGAPWPPPAWPRSRSGGRPAWSGPTLTHRNSRSGHEPWPRASSCTWPCLAWPTSVPSSGSTLSGSISHPRLAASITGSTRAGRRIGVAELTSVDLVICGSVAVNRQGARVGKGGGFSDLEFALLVEAGERRSSPAATPNGPRGSSGTTSTRPRSPPSLPWPPGHGGAERSAVTCRCEPMRGRQEGGSRQRWVPCDHPARCTIGLVNRPICPSLGS